MLPLIKIPPADIALQKLVRKVVRHRLNIDGRCPRPQVYLAPTLTKSYTSTRATPVVLFTPRTIAV